MEQNGQDILVRMKGISKHFGGVQALSNVDLELRKGEVLALLGDNGAGKSTLIKILTGDVIKDSGEIFFRDQKVEINHPSDSIKLGIEAIYQDLALIRTFNLAENFFLGKEIVHRKFLIPLLDKKKMVQKSQEILRNSLGIAVGNIHDSVFKLSGGQQQAVAIGRALNGTPDVIIMDEPTASLGAEGMRRLIDLIIRLKQQGISIIIISHNLEHVLAVADRLIVLWRGKVAGTLDKDKTNRTEIVHLIVSGEAMAQSR